MCTSDLFLKFVRGVLLCVLLAIAAIGIAHGQNAGAVAIQAQMVQVFTSQSTTASSGGIWGCGVASGACSVFPDIQQGSQILFYCNTSFVGTIDLEFSLTGKAPFFPVAEASYPTGFADSACHQLPLAGYWPNLRSTVTPSSGSLSAVYTANSGPVPPVLPGLGTNGPAPPINCDRNQAISATSPATTTFAIGPSLAGDTVFICAFTVTFSAATSTGTVAVGWASSNANCATGTVINSWLASTTSGTPQTYTVNMLQRSPDPPTGPSALPFPCFQNSSGATAFVSISYASVHGL